MKGATRRSSASAPDEAPDESDRFSGAPHPRETSRLIGHAQAERVLLDAYRSGRLPHAWLIGGPEGIGKATLAWRFARFVLANPDYRAAAVQEAADLFVPPDHPVASRIGSLAHADVTVLRREWDTKGKKHFTVIRVDEVRAALRMFQQSASAGGYRIVILDSAEDLNSNAANALLKIMEEPPALSLFLVIAHEPARVLPTIRSRCARLMLEPLSSLEVTQAVEAIGEPFAGDDEMLNAAVRRSEGSVRRALRYMNPGLLAFIQRLDAILKALPDLDLRQAHAIADAVSGREAAEQYETMIALILDWLDARVRRGGASVARLAPYALVWDKLRAAARETDVFNLDKRPLVLSIFTDLAAAERASRL